MISPILSPITTPECHGSHGFYTDLNRTDGSIETKNNDGFYNNLNGTDRFFKQKTMDSEPLNFGMNNELRGLG